jgi:hypothetical protein
MKLTDFVVARVKPPAAGRIEIWDSVLPSFGLRVSEKGTKSWMVMVHVRGAPAGKRRVTLGRYPVLSLAKARERARHIFEAVFDGIDPAATPAAVRPPTPAFEVIAEQFITRYAKPKNRGWKRQQADLKREFTPDWGKKPIDTITRRDVLDVLDRISDRASPQRANRQLALIRKFFSWCLERGILETSPAANIKPPGREASRDRVLSDSEIRSVWICCDALGHPFGRSSSCSSSMRSVSQLTQARLWGDWRYSRLDRIRPKTADLITRQSGLPCCPAFDEFQKFGDVKWLTDVGVTSTREDLRLVTGHGKRSDGDDWDCARLLIGFKPTSGFHSGNIR